MPDVGGTRPGNPSANASTGDEIVALATKYLGDRYVYAATGPSQFDCSGLTQYVYKQAGIAIPRTSQEQYASLPAIAAADARPGDLVFFGGSGPGYSYDGTPAAPGHVGIYIGNGMMINALNQSAGVLKTSTAGAVGYRRPNGIMDNGSIEKSGTPQGGGSGNQGLFSIPTEIVGFFQDIDTWVGDFYKSAALFFKPSTYVRIGAGVFGAGFILAGILFLMREAKTP